MYENLSDFDKALGNFGDKAGIIASLEISGKISSEEAFQKIKELYKELKQLKKRGFKMNHKYHELWKVLNRLDEEIGDINVALKLLDVCAEHITASDQDSALNCLIGTKEYLLHLQHKLDITFRETWGMTITPPIENE
jgi:hypothetical protein